MLFLSTRDNGLLCECSGPDVHDARSAIFSQPTGRDANDFSVRSLRFPPTNCRTLLENGRSIPCVEDEQAVVTNVTPSVCHRRDHVSVLDLVSEDREHHQSRVELSAEIHGTEVSENEFQTPQRSTLGALGFCAHQHRGGRVDTRNVVAFRRQRKRVTTRAATEVDYRADGKMRVSVENRLDEVALRLIRLVAVKRVVQTCVVVAEDRCQLSDSFKASQTSAISWVVNEVAEGR